MEITFKKGAPTIRSVKHVEKGNFSMILYRIAKILLWRVYGTDLVQLTHIEKKNLKEMQSLKKKKLYGPFLWMGFNCLKARATSRRQFTFYH